MQLILSRSRFLRAGGKKSIRSFQRCLSGTTGESMERKRVFGFHSSDFSSPQEDATLLERSLRLGCDMFLCSAGRSTAHFERLAEISSIDEVSLDGISIGNRVTSIDKFNSETKDATDSFCGRALDFSIIPLGLTYLQKDVNSSMKKLTEDISLLENDSDGKCGDIGVELSTNVLRHCVLPKQSTRSAFKNLKLDSDSEYSLDQLICVLDELYEGGHIRQLVCASNVFTLPVSLALRDWSLQKLNVKFMASEVLRGHPKSPGLLVSPSAQSGGINQLPSMSITEALDLFKKTVNACIQMEKEFIEKSRSSNSDKAVPQSFPPLTHFCMGMVLAKTQGDILFPQEWASIFREQVEPNFEKACQLLKKADDCDEVEIEKFLTIYIPMKRNLIRSFESLLNARHELLCSELKTIVEAEHRSSSGLDTLEENSKHIYSTMSLHECIAKSWSGALAYDDALEEDHRNPIVLLGGVEVPSTMWSSKPIDSNDASTNFYLKYLQILSNNFDKEFYANNQ